MFPNEFSSAFLCEWSCDSVLPTFDTSDYPTCGKGAWKLLSQTLCEVVCINVKLHKFVTSHILVKVEEVTLLVFGRNSLAGLLQHRIAVRVFVGVFPSFGQALLADFLVLLGCSALLRSVMAFT